MNQEIKAMTERLQELQERIGANKSFLQHYLLDPSGDNRPAEDERLRELTGLAEETEAILEEAAAIFEKTCAEAPAEETDGAGESGAETVSAEAPEESAEGAPEAEEAPAEGSEPAEIPEGAEDVIAEMAEAEDGPISVEYKTHEVGTPDGSDNIEGDWTIDGDEEILDAEELQKEAEALTRERKEREKRLRKEKEKQEKNCLLYTSPSPRD